MDIGLDAFNPQQTYDMTLMASKNFDNSAVRLPVISQPRWIYDTYCAKCNSIPDEVALNL